MIQIRAGFEMEYHCPHPTPMLLSLSIHYSRASDLIRPDLLVTQPAVPTYAYRDLFGNWCTRLVAAWFEVWLGDRWHTFDARNNTPRIGRVLMARGRDACDVALASTFGPNTLARFKVWTDDVTPQPAPA